MRTKLNKNSDMSKRIVRFILAGVLAALPTLRAADVVQAEASESPASGRSVARTISANQNSACVIANSRMYCWGHAGDTRIGFPSGPVVSTPRLVAGMPTNLIGVAVGADHACGLQSTGTVTCVGRTTYGQTGAITTDSNYIATVSTPSDFTSITAGENFTCGISANSSSSVYCWGRNSNGELGVTNSSLPSSAPPQEISVGETVDAVAAGNYHVCALLVSTRVKCWGDNTYGQVGNSTYVPTPTPTAVRDGGSDLSGVVALSAGGATTCAVLTNGQGRCWGAGSFGQLATGSVVSAGANTAQTVLDASSSPSTDLVSVSAGARHTCFIRNSGRVACAGDNTEGEIGNGESGASRVLLLAAVQTSLASTASASAVAAGRDYTCVIGTDGSASCWGTGVNGTLANAQTTSSSSPQEVVGVAAQSITFAPPATKALNDVPFGISATSSSRKAVTFSSTTSSVCTVAGSTVTILNAGTCTIRANAAANGFYQASGSTEASIAVAGIAPAATTQAATSVSSSRATLNATVNPGALDTAVYFEYGLKEDLSDAAQLVAKVDTGITAVDVAATASSLTERKKYYFRVVATNSKGTSRGDTLSFTSLRPVGVSINDAAEFTNKKSVTVSVTGPSGSTQAILSNDGGFKNSTTFTLVDNSADIPWTLVASKDERLPKVVYVKFVTRLGNASTPYQDDIILDTTAPTFTGATATGTASGGPVTIAAVKRKGASITVRASDKNSGLGAVEVRSSSRKAVTKISLSNPRASSARVAVSTTAKTLQVRVIDRAGNASAWRTIPVK